MSALDALQRWRQNPFFLLGVAPTASDAEIEREGRKLLAQLELGLQAVVLAQTPLGTVERTPDAVRAALAQLRDPRKRQRHALWARVPPRPAGAAASSDGALEPFAGAMAAVGWPGL